MYNRPDPTSVIDGRDRPGMRFSQALLWGSGMSNNDTVVEPINNFFAGGSRHAADLVRQVARSSPPKSGRSRISATKGDKRRRALPMGPTPERLAKGDIPNRTAGGFHRALPIIERLRDTGKLDHDARNNEAMFQAAEKLRRHFEGCMIGVQAQDLNKVIAGGASDDLVGEENWVHHYDSFRKACRLMGWTETSPHRGAGRIVVAVVCYETSIREAADNHLPAARTETMQITAMDRLREGLFVLATHWRMC